MVSPFSMRPRARAISRIACAAFLILLTTNALAVQQPPPRTPQPLDPLTAAERKDAESVARADARVKELLGGGRTRLVYVDFIAVKRSDAGDAPDVPTKLDVGRHAEVVFYRYDDDSGVRAVVDVLKKAVVQAERVDSAEVPLNTEELSESFALALKNDAVTSLLGADAKTFRVADVGAAAKGAAPRNIIHGLRVVATSDADSCWRHRCVQLFFRRGDVYLIDSVVVDLTAQQSRVERGQR
jgi:hypothetical protein